MSTVNPVFDYPIYGMHDTFGDERFEPLIDEGLEAGKSAEEIFDLLKEEQVRQLRADSRFRDRLRQIYSDAGVNLISPTMGSYSLSDPNVNAEGQRRDISNWHGKIDVLDWMHKVTSPKAAREVAAQGDVGIILNTQNLGYAIEGDIDEIDRLYNFGIRIAQLTYNTQNLVGTGCTERVDSGLSTHGVETVERMNDLGMVVDLAHCGKQTTMDAIDLSEKPVAFTHTFCQAIADHDRGKSDEEIELLAENDGYMGIQVTPPFISPDDPSQAFDRFFDHVEHAVSILGIDNVGIGSDWGVIPSKAIPEKLRPGLRDHFGAIGFREEHGVDIGMGFGPIERFEDWQHIPDGLAEHGYSTDDIAAITGKNFVDFWERTV